MTKTVKIVFYLDDDSVYNGGARPLINWAKVIPDSILMSLQRSGDPKVLNSIYMENIEEAARAAKDYEYIVVSDNNLKNGIKLSRRIGAKLVIYCQVPFGLHSLGVMSVGEKKLVQFIYFVIKMIPFRILVSQYVKRLKKGDLIIANSTNMNILLNFVYGITDSEIVYPPLEDTKFVPIPVVKKDSILVFVGRSGDLNEYRALEAIEEISKSYGSDVLIFGSAPLPESFRKRYKVLKNITDDELVKLYNRSYVTVCIQKQEYFGYVPIESILCGTPSITFYRHDASNVNQSLSKYLIYTDANDLKKHLTTAIESQLRDELLEQREFILSKFSLVNSKCELLEKLRHLG